MQLPRVYAITDTQISGLSHADQVRLLADGGATFVQLREKNLPALNFYREAKAATEISGVRIVINDRADVALAVKAVGVHLGQDDLPPEAARTLLGDEAIIGYSTHNIVQAQAAASLPVDYIAIGPIFRTTTKANADPEVGLNGLRAVRKAIGDIPLVAIGGITPENAPAVIEAGADSVAVISGLLSGGPAAISAQFRALTELLSSRQT